jgi:UTP-glucose-1-phosphate uridylyltransferase
MSSSPTLLVLAAGMGSRYGGLKQIDPVGPDGEFIIDYSVHDAMRAGFRKIVFVIRKDIEEAFTKTIVSRLPKDCEVKYAFQELDMLPEGFSVPDGRKKPWGTGHALWVARDLVKEPALVINADDFYGAAAYQTAAEHFGSLAAPQKNDYFMVGYSLRKTVSLHGPVSRGVCRTDDRGFLADVTEIKEITIDPAAKSIAGPPPGVVGSAAMKSFP